MNLKPIKSNMTELTVNVAGFRGDTKILFSYETPVAAMNLSPEWFKCYQCACIKTSKKWSKTTSRHINQWLAGGHANTVSQAAIEALV